MCYREIIAQRPRLGVKLSSAPSQDNALLQVTHTLDCISAWPLRRVRLGLCSARQLDPMRRRTTTP